MTKKQRRTNSAVLINILGWFGTVATLSAYLLISLKLIGPQELSYQFLNLTGALGLGVICLYKKTYQPFFVNLIWGLVAIVAILNILLFVKV